MELTVNHVLQAYMALRQIILERRVLPQIGAYRLARLHAQLEPEALLIEQKRLQIIKDLVGEEPNDGPTGYKVPPEQMKDYTAGWTELSNQIVQINCRPVNLMHLGINASITAEEFLKLGSLIVETEEEKPVP